MVWLSDDDGGTIFPEFYAAVAHAEPIFNLETIAQSLDTSNPDKVLLLSLVDLARSHVGVITVTSVPFGTNEVELCYSWRNTLVAILQSYRYAFLSALLKRKITPSQGCMDTTRSPLSERHVFSSGIY